MKDDAWFVCIRFASRFWILEKEHGRQLDWFIHAFRADIIWMLAQRIHRHTGKRTIENLDVRGDWLEVAGSEGIVCI